VAIWILLLPLLGSGISGLFCRIINPRLAELVTTSFMLLSAALACTTFFNVVFGHAIEHQILLPWIMSGDLVVHWSLYVDSLTAVMLIVVTIVSSLVHLYAIGYMSHDPHRPRFMSYLSLFTFFMLMLVTSDNLVQLFLGWEGVGLCSYLLISFWFYKDSATRAAMKAFLVNRVGDLGFALGIFAAYMVFGTVEFSALFAKAAANKDQLITVFSHSFHAITLICVLLFIGAMGKSAQLGLHTWLPDAMEGPTPVSALIHAATMVTAGVFMVARCSPLFELSPFALDLVTIVGACTSIFAATIAITQNDIKRIIAYSTCSQLGYMFFACGVSAYGAGVFHLMTHAFFKALLFLGAGSVIHALSGEQDIRRMGGIWRLVPVTYLLMWIGSLALAGIFPFAGYFSKDIILEAAYASGRDVGYFAYYVGLFVAFLTAFYSWRLLFLVFHGPTRAAKDIMDHVHESPVIMLIPLVLLAIGALGSGWVASNLWGIVEPHGDFFGKSIVMLAQPSVLEKAHQVPLWVKYAPLVLGILGILLAYIIYVLYPRIAVSIANNFRPIYRFFLNKWFIDELYDFCFIRFSRFLGSWLSVYFERYVTDGVPRFCSYLSLLIHRAMVRCQTGYVYHYASVMLAALTVLSLYYVFYPFVWSMK
jgi:NADH-quinone oxidoreductase subunit L